MLGFLVPVLLFGAALQACQPSPPVPQGLTAFTVGGNVTGFGAEDLVLQNNGGDDLPVASNGQFKFATPLQDGAAYSVTVKTQPVRPAQTCTVDNGAGTIAGSNVTNVLVKCTTISYHVGGTVSGLAGSGLVLQNNGRDDVSPDPDGGFTFETALQTGAPYSVTVRTQPASPAQTCVPENATGTIESSDVTNVLVACCTPGCADSPCGGPDGCGGTCPSCPAGTVCYENQCCTPYCAPGACGVPDRCGGTCSASCPSGQVCYSNQCCTPSCAGKPCGGPDGCGGTCPSCPAGAVCYENQCCTPNCASKPCGGPNGCGGKCPSCPAGRTCYGNSCCRPSCKPCGGSDGCGGACPSCPADSVCYSNHCCRPSCPDNSCGGSNGCGGVCQCSAGVCYNGQCCTPTCADSPCGGPDGCGGFCKKGSGCCTPHCSPSRCGDNGCGGDCKCPQGKMCQNGRCVQGLDCSDSHPCPSATDCCIAKKCISCTQTQ